MPAPVTTASPTVTSSTPTYCGLRTYRYRPATTNSRGGSYGAGVPRPRRMNSTKQTEIAPAPSAIGTTPTQRAGPRWSDGPSLVATNAIGTATRTVPGTSSVNNAVRNQSIRGPPLADAIKV